MCNSITQIFGSGVAYGTSSTHSKFASWRIFFLIIGLITIIVGFAVFMVLPDSPVKALRFTEAEKVAALLRVKENQSGTQNATLKKEQVLAEMSEEEKSPVREKLAYSDETDLRNPFFVYTR